MAAVDPAAFRTYSTSVGSRSLEIYLAADATNDRGRGALEIAHRLAAQAGDPMSRLDTVSLTVRDEVAAFRLPFIEDTICRMVSRLLR